MGNISLVCMDLLCKEDVFLDVEVIMQFFILKKYVTGIETYIIT